MAVALSRPQPMVKKARERERWVREREMGEREREG
jgi:hypothetical protein